MVVTVLLSILVPIQAGANAGAPQSPSWKVVSPDLIARGDARQALALEWFLAMTGRGSVAKYQRDLSTFVAKWGDDRFSSGYRFASSTAVLTGMPTTQTLSMSQYAEQSPSQYCVSGVLTCHCGPSAAESILQYVKPTSYFGEVLINNGDFKYGQYGLAGVFGDPTYGKSTKYLETNYWGGETPWFSSRTDWPMSMSFNYWYSGSVNGLPYYTENPAPYSGAHLTLAQYQADLTSDIWNQGAGGWPLAADVEEYPGKTPYLRGHNTAIEIQHWVALYGYGGSGTYTDYIDPIAGSALNGTDGFNVNALNTGYASSSMFALVTYAGAHGGPYGIVW
jgi:hypothetical protein